MVIRDFNDYVKALVEILVYSVSNWMHNKYKLCEYCITEQLAV